jgi:hypothetical protein
MKDRKFRVQSSLFRSLRLISYFKEMKEEEAQTSERFYDKHLQTKMFAELILLGRQ